MPKLSKHTIEIHLAVLLFGGAGLFGKLVQISAGGIVLGRAFLAAIFIFILTQLWGEKLELRSKKDGLRFCVLGIILAFHWVAFFKAIQLSSVAVGLLMFSTFPIFTTFLEPIQTKEKLHGKDILLAILTFVGVGLVMPSLDFGQQDTQGALWGIAAGFSFAILALICKQMGKNYSSNFISGGQNAVAALVLLPLFWKDVWCATWNDWFWLLILGVVFTGIAHTLFISSMQGMKAQTASLITSLEPVYGILFAWLLFNETPSVKMLLGGGIILGVAFYATVVDN